MSLELRHIFLWGLGYLVLLFVIALAADRGWLPRRWVTHPLTHVLSLGVYATSWSYYGSVGFANGAGYLFLTIYLGVTLAFLLAPVLLQPILRLAREYQLASLADLLAFRYRSQGAGVLTTLFMLVGTLPYIALQIRAVTQSLQVLTHEAPPHILALGFCLLLTAFAMLFGARHIRPREQHGGLVTAIAFESLVKTLTLVGVGIFALFGVFGGPEGLSAWLAAHPEAVDRLYRPVGEAPWGTLIFLAFGAAFLLPRQFHMLFAENQREQNLTVAGWAFPLLLLTLNLPIPVILWAGQAQNLQLDPDYFVLGITLHQGHPWLPLATFLGGLSAASAMVIVTTLALSSMCLNHLLLPLSYPDPRVDLYYWLLWGRRLLIGLIILAGYSFYAVLEHRAGLVQLGLVSFVAVAQFLPGILGLLYWRRATREGFLAGLVVGMSVWAATLLVPILADSGLFQAPWSVAGWEAMTGQEHWSFATFWSVALNGFFFVLVSLLTRQRPEEAEAAHSCCTTTFVPLSGTVSAGSPEEFKHQLAEVLGRATADKEVDRALAELGMSPRESRPAELRRLRERIERNLYGLIGPQLSHLIVNRKLVLDPSGRTALADSMRHVEEQLERSRSLLQGLTRELDELQRHLRQILEDLPLGACALGQEGEIILWNQAMEKSTGLAAAQVIGHTLAALPEPWNDLLAGFSRAGDTRIHHAHLTVDHQDRWFNLHKARVSGTRSPAPGMVILMEDLTQMENLEAELAHSDRLASIGRLAAGLAHEVGNPLTGIMSITQNLLYEEPPPALRAGLEEILTQARRIDRIIRSLMDFSRRGEARQESRPVDLARTLDEALALVRLTHKEKGIRFLVESEAGLTLQGDPQQLAQALVNLLANACDASPPRGVVAIHAHRRGSSIEVTIRDQGEGIPEAVRARLFEPFTTTKPPGRGTGLGLSLARAIVVAHGGEIEIESEPGRGTLVRLHFPT